MKITQIMLAKGFGGAERYFVDLCLALADTDHRVQAVCHRDFHGRDQLQQNPALEVVTVNVLGWWDFIAWHRITAAVRAFRPDVMHAHLARAAYIGGKVRRRTGIPLAVKTHNYVDLKYYRNVDRFFPTTQDQQRYLVGNGIDAERARVIPNFSSLSPVTTSWSGANDASCLVFGSYGRMVAKKGFDGLIKAFQQALENNIAARLVVGGDGVEYESLQQQVAATGQADRIELCGWVSDATAFLDNIDVFVLPSLDEPFGIVVLEAMARGRPIISTRTQGPSEVLSEETAFLVNTGDIDGLSQTLCRVARSPDEAARRASRALARFKATYARDVVVPQLLDQYASMISGL